MSIKYNVVISWHTVVYVVSNIVYYFYFIKYIKIKLYL